MTSYTNTRDNSTLAGVGFKDGDDLTTANGSRWVYQNEQWYPVTFGGSPAIKSLAVTTSSVRGIAKVSPGPTAPPLAVYANSAVGLPKVLIFGCSIAQQCNAYLHDTPTANPTTVTTTVGGHKAKSTVLNVANGSLFAAGDRFSFPLFNGRMYVAKILSITANALTLTAPIPAAVRDAQSVCKLTTAQSSASMLQGLGAANAGVALLGGPAEVLPAYGYGGALFVQMYADLERDLRRYRPNVVIMHPYENDLCISSATTGASLAQLIGWTRWVTNLCLSYGATPVMCSSMPYYRLTPLAGILASRKADYFAILDYLTKPVSNGQTQYQLDCPGAYGVDLSTPWLDPAYANDASYPCRPLPGWTDGVHPNTGYRFGAGINVASVLQQILPAARSWLDLCLSPSEVAAMGGSTGSVVNMQAGSVAPKNWTIQAYGTAVATSTKNADGSLKIAANWPNASSRTGDFIKAKYSFTFPTVWPGGTARFKVYLRYRINGMNQMAQVYPNAYLAPNLDNYSGDTGSDMLLTHPTDARVMLLTTPHFEIGYSAESGTWNTSVEISFTIAPNTLASPSGASVDIDVFECGIVAAQPETPHDFV